MFWIYTDKHLIEKQETPLTSDPKVWTRAEATDFVIHELEAILPDLPARVAGDASIVNIDAGHFLLAKIYLNLGVFKAANPAGPYTFEAANMNKVIAHIEAIHSSLADSYWDNFAPDNNNSPEILFSSKNVLGDGGAVGDYWRYGMHYNQTPDGYNGFCTVGEYYDRLMLQMNAASIQHLRLLLILEPNRISVRANVCSGNLQMRLLVRLRQEEQFLYKDRNGNPLFFTKEVTLIVSGPTIETAGIRTQKYQPDVNSLDHPENDFILMRYADAFINGSRSNS